MKRSWLPTPAPASRQLHRVASLALMFEASRNLEIKHFADVDLQVGASPARTTEQPCLGSLVRRTHLRVGQRVTSAGPRGVERDPPDHSMIWVLSISRRRVERQ